MGGIFDGKLKENWLGFELFEIGKVWWGGESRRLSLIDLENDGDYFLWVEVWLEFFSTLFWIFYKNRWSFENSKFEFWVFVEI